MSILTGNAWAVALILVSVGPVIVMVLVPIFPARFSATATRILVPGARKTFRASKVLPLMRAGMAMASAAVFPMVSCFRLFVATVPCTSTHKALMAAWSIGSVMETVGAVVSR